MTDTDRDRTTSAAAELILAAHATGLDIAEWVAGVLARAAAALGSTDALLANRPGSWEAAHVRALLAGTVGADDEYLGSETAYPPRPHCLPGCDRLDGHDGRDPGACMSGGIPLEAAEPDAAIEADLREMRKP